VPTEKGVGLNHLETSSPTGPASVQRNPQEPVAAVEAQVTRRVLLENWSEPLRFQVGRSFRYSQLPEVTGHHSRNVEKAPLCG